MAANHYGLGTVEASEQLLSDLYLDLRAKLARWASITHQTAQARMGYIGQHLTSVVTGLPGGKSGARGYDLIHPDKTFSEIKTCSRVDQLGSCGDCGAAISPVEERCGCGSKNIIRKEDSKWLIGIRNETEFAEVLDPKTYYLVLFDFPDLAKPDVVRASIWTVDPQGVGFAACMADYYLNIQSKSASKAPFNLWPYKLKFDIMRPTLIYRSLLEGTSKIVTEVFPGRDDAREHVLQPLPDYSGSDLPVPAITDFASRLKMTKVLDGLVQKKAMLTALQKEISGKKLPNAVVADALAASIYKPLIARHVGSLPPKFRKAVAPAT